ncbi:hypothetical protein XENOCAPTIV_019953 [Xenoophorus captivus]|uniref:Fibronectin type-III domain-containing protein n=1 Tax=Xenoophorus captivus TaxID=1517983 RepID=A0ABV0RL79_9TELE
MQTFNGPRCDLYKNILARGCNAAAVITAESIKGPLDLYILMDFSNSMQDDLDNLKKMGNELVPCSGLGDCQPCGTCVCYNPDQYEGPYCQYDKTHCPRFAGILCNGEKVLDYCSFRDEDDDCTYQYTVDTSKDATNNELLVEVLKERGEVNILHSCDSIAFIRSSNTNFHMEDYTIMDTVVTAPRRTYPDIVKLTEKNVQSGNFGDLKVVPGYYTVATDREAAGAVEFQENVESVDVHVPLFVKDDDDDKKQLLVEARDVPLGIAEIAKRFVNITIIKEHATSVFSFLQPKYTYSRQDGVANIPINREIIEDGRTQVTYCTQDLTAKNKKDYKSVQGDLSYGPGETQKIIPVPLLELNEKDGFLEDKPIKQFVMDLSNPRQGAKLGRYPRTTVTITDLAGLRSPEVAQLQSKGFISPKGKSPGGSFPAPGNLKAKATGPKNIRLNWDPPPGNPLGYKVKYWIYGDPEKDAQVLDVKTPQAELTNLYPYCDYEMRVCGYNAMGDGHDTNIVSCQTLEDVPGEPGRLAFNVISPTVTQLSWAEPAETNGNITAYEVIYTPIDDEMSGFGYTGVHSSSHTQYSYSLSQGSRARTQSSEVNEALYSLDRVLHGKSPAYMHEVSGFIRWVCKSNPLYTPSRLVFSALGPTALKVSWQEPHCEKDILGYCVLYQLLSGGMNALDSCVVLLFAFICKSVLFTRFYCHCPRFSRCSTESRPLVFIVLSPAGEMKRINVTNPAENSVVIHDLLPNHSYLFKVKAQSQEGWGPEREGVITIESAVDPKSPLSPMPGT